MPVSRFRTSLEDALDNYVNAANAYAEAATSELAERVATRYPGAATIQVTAILTEDYTEHDLVVLDADGTPLNEHDDWPFDEDPDWFTRVTEGICVFEDVVEVPIEGG